MFNPIRSAVLWTASGSGLDALSLLPPVEPESSLLTREPRYVGEQ